MQGFGDLFTERGFAILKTSRQAKRGRRLYCWCVAYKRVDQNGDVFARWAKRAERSHRGFPFLHRIGRREPADNEWSRRAQRRP